MQTDRQAETDRRTDRQDKANGRFSRHCERPQDKIVHSVTWSLYRMHYSTWSWSKFHSSRSVTTLMCEFFFSVRHYRLTEDSTGQTSNNLVNIVRTVTRLSMRGGTSSLPHTPSWPARGQFKLYLVNTEIYPHFCGARGGTVGWGTALEGRWFDSR